MELCENIRKIRKSKGMTQEELAEAIGITSASVSKWETGQSAPELSMLVVLADFFEVSVDALLGHGVKAERQKEMLDTLAALARERQFGEAQTLAEKLLRNYPNSYEVVDRAAELYRQIAITNADRAASVQAILLVKRLFLLHKDGGKGELALQRRLASYYESFEDWDMARKYYELGNVSGINDRQLAHLEAREKKDPEVIRKISRVLTQNLFGILSDLVTLADIWNALGDSHRAAAALKWGIQAIQGCGAELCKGYAPLVTVLYLTLMKADSEHAEAHAQTVAKLAGGEPETQAVEFLLLEEPHLIASPDFYAEDYPMNLLRQFGSEDLACPPLKK